MRVATILRGEEGQGLAEYAMILGFVALAVIAGLAIFGEDVANLMAVIVEKV
jgi:Flp pilus assembly pilin Flp